MSVLEAFTEAIASRAKDLEERKKTYFAVKKRRIAAQGEEDSAGLEVDGAKRDLRRVCISYLAFIEGKVLESNHPCAHYQTEYKVMARKGSELDRT